MSQSRTAAKTCDQLHPLSVYWREQNKWKLPHTKEGNYPVVKSFPEYSQVDDKETLPGLRGLSYSIHAETAIDC